ncbi:hypothetical protein MTR_4g056210 [Medicago truncatula]|uniref:Uncharacterized protein n=1 Tax=Medicago truncatula TaxID=3880 RepID=A0A072UKL0_MEDTR|nr:hypothetical protein MTR_4g056210 [Medicago truncatula]
MYSLPTLSSLYPKQKRKVKRHPMRSLTYRGIIAVQVANKNHEDSPEDDNRLQRLARVHDDLVQPCQKKLKQTSNKKVRPREIQERDFVPKKVLSFQPDSRGKWTPNYEGSHSPLGASSYQKTSDKKHLQIKDSEQGHSKLLGRIAVVVFNVPFPLHLPFFQNFHKSVEPCPWQVKCTSASASRAATFRKRNMAKQYGEDLYFEQDAVTVQKYKKRNTKKSKLAKLKT